MSSNNKHVLVFGPTGGVGCAAATEAHRRGAHVWLAMRDTNKLISGLKEDSNYTRVQADLSKPDTLKHAVDQSGATSAFVYCLLESPDNMRSAFSALKDAGITYIVLLSSFSVQGSSASDESNMSHFIGRAHAQIEIALEESGITYTAVRPAYFSSNVLWNKEDIKKGELEIVYPEVKFDYISPTDIGTVCGSILAEEKFRPSKPVFLCGPALMTQREAHGIIERVLGHELKIKEIDEASWYEKLSYMPKPVLDSLSAWMRDSIAGVDDYATVYEEGVANIEKYAERQPTKFEEWVQANKDAFA
jgi:uncharacterized protein YbjT (DUF2867 family)